MSKRTKAKLTVERDDLDAETVNQPTTPQNPDELADYIRTHMGAQIAPSALTPGSDGPLAYLVHSFFEGRFLLDAGGKWTDLGASGKNRPPTDCVVWANRGGGKTFLGAVATALDLVFKPTIEVRILGGSAEQGRRMHEHLRAIFEHESLEPLLDGRTTETRVRLKNGSRVEILSHSERSVRGVRVQKLRCDEVDLFDPELWEAAQLVTRSTSPIPGPWGDEVKGTIEVLSTMHVPMGTMWKVVKETGRTAEWLTPPPSPGSGGAGESRGEGALNDDPPTTEAPSSSPPGATGLGSASPVPIDPQPPESSSNDKPSRILFKWGVIDSLAPCNDEHTCKTCALHEDCRGRAKERQLGGHMTIHDALVLKKRVSRETWETEMLCREPSRNSCVYPDFSRTLHVLPRDITPEEAAATDSLLIAGMDFGIRAPSVVVWGLLRSDGRLTIIDEYDQIGRTLGDHVAAIKARPWGLPKWIGIDPAGVSRNEQTGTSNFTALRNMQLAPKASRPGLGAGLESVRSRLSPAQGPPGLVIAPRCTNLIDALTRYHYPAGKTGETLPEKDGSDHWCDALRYLVTNLDAKGVAVGHT